MPKPSTDAAGRPRERLIVFGLLSLALYVVYYRSYTQMGLYEDDWSAIAPYANGKWLLVWTQVHLWLTHWPNGRPLGLTVCAVAAWCLYKVGGLAALYILPYSIVLACSWTMFRILRESLGLIAAFVGAITFALLPTDTLRLSLHGAPHLYLAVVCMLLAVHACQCRAEWAAAPLTFLGLLFHESSTLTIFLGPLLVCSLTKDFLGRALRYLGFAMLGILSVFALRIFVFAEQRAASTFFNLPQVLERSLGSLKSGTITHWTLIAQRCREGFHLPVSGSLLALTVLLAIFAFVLIWQGNGNQRFHNSKGRGAIAPLKAGLFGILAFSVPYLVYFTDPYWPANHIAGRIASVHSASGVGFAFAIAGVAGLIQLLPSTAARIVGTATYVIPLAALLSWGNVIRVQYVEAWQNERFFWAQMLDHLGNIKANTIMFSVRENYWTPPFTWVIGSNSWADSIVLRHIYSFPPEWPRDPRVFSLVGPWQNEIREQDGKLTWRMPAGDWAPVDVPLEPENLMIFVTKEGKPVPLDGEIEIAGHHLKLMNPSHGQRPLFKKEPLFKDLLGADER